MEEKGFIVALSLTDIVPMASIDEVKFYEIDNSTSVLLNGKACMQNNVPVVEWPIAINKVEEWAITIEQLISGTPAWHHRQHLNEMLSDLRSMLVYHKQQHETVVTEAPTIEDLSAYLSYYAASRHV